MLAKTPQSPQSSAVGPFILYMSNTIIARFYAAPHKYHSVNFIMNHHRRLMSDLLRDFFKETIKQ